MSSFLSTLPGALVMAPMTKGSNLPYRRLCTELGARILVSEMVVARRLKQRRRGELALVRRAPDEPCFGVQIAGNQPDELAWAAAFAESRGADFVDLNLGCPIDHFTRRGLGASLLRKPGRVARLLEAMRTAVSIPVTVKIRLGWDADHRNYLQLARIAVDAGASALTVHGRTREARYRHPADWDAIAEIASQVSIPVIGNGDLLYGHDAAARCTSSGCAAVMTARGALIRPWIFREVAGPNRDLPIEERIAIYRRYVDLAVAHWGRRERPDEIDSAPALDDHGRERLKDFLRWHVGFWVRDVPRHDDGTWPTMQTRERPEGERSALETLFTRTDESAIEYITTELVAGGEFSAPPVPGGATDAVEEVEAG